LEEAGFTLFKINRLVFFAYSPVQKTAVNCWILRMHSLPHNYLRNCQDLGKAVSGKLHSSYAQNCMCIFLHKITVIFLFQQKLDCINNCNTILQHQISKTSIQWFSA
jgi:hypothetical protein